ncbi:MAG: HD domain-containing protein [Acidimicrobiia bacterium]|nr:HD domain-containing protein [Acidimicrobiia bacterium]
MKNRSLRQGQLPIRRRRASVFFALVGVSVLVASFMFAGMTFPAGEIFWPLAIPSFYLAYRSVSVADQLSASATVMISLSAGVAFALTDAHSATFGLAALSALTPVMERDLQERRLHEPIWNFGQLVVTGAATGLVLDLLISPGTGPLMVLVAAALAAGVNFLLNIGQVYWIVRFIYSKTLTNLWSGAPVLVPAHLLMGLVGGVLGFAFVEVDRWFLLPLLVVLFLSGHQQFVSYAELRTAYRATLAGFVKALEAKDFYTRGHSERVAYFATISGEELGMRGAKLEHVQYAALLHDLGKTVVPKDLIQKKGRLTEDEWKIMRKHDAILGELLGPIDFLKPVVDAAEGHNLRFDDPDDHGIEAGVLSVADAFDAMTSTRSYRVALSQQYAFEELRRHAGGQFDPKAVEALIAAVVARGELYGSPDVHDEETARRLAEEKSDLRDEIKVSEDN